MIAAVGVALGDRVAVEIELDPEPLPTDAVPPDLARAIRASKTAGAGWDRTSPAHRREHVEHVLEAKQPETRARRVGKTVEALEAAARAARPARTPAKLRPRRS